jgi:hypothetical protein
MILTPFLLPEKLKVFYEFDVACDAFTCCFA